MYFYRVEGTVKNETGEASDNTRKSRGEARKIAVKSDEFNEKYCQDSLYFISECFDGIMVIGVITANIDEPEKRLSAYIKNTGYEIENIRVYEVTISIITRMLRAAAHRGYIADEDELLARFGIDKVSRRWNDSIEYGENLIKTSDRSELFKRAEKILLCDTLIPELKRIYCNNSGTEKSVKKVKGHPVHYVIETDDFDIRRESCRILLEALYSNRRIWSKRYCFLDFKHGEHFSASEFNALYKLCIGGTVIIRYLGVDHSEEDGYASSELNTIESICEVVKKYKNEVLSIICLPRESTASKRYFYECLGAMCFVEVKEEQAEGDKAKEFLKMLTKEHRIRGDKNLWCRIEEGKGYLTTELHYIFDEWYNNKLRRTVYPQYNEFKAVKADTLKSAPTGSAYDELQEMIGLSEAKAVIAKSLNYYKIQKLYEEKGLKRDNPAMHMIFTGNPGTAKTTVARLFASIMRDNGLLSCGHLVEVGRGDLVGKYVGWTAKTVQSKFKAASGGVLFIDEAYSLIDDRSGSFGDEAINTIVQEMENHREDVVVIFAGYPDKMEGFLDKNPGLRSRIAFHVPFEDYNTDELYSIAELMGHKKGIHFDDEAKKRLMVLFDEIKKQEDFGNGRYVRNLIEQARMNQASRLLECDFDRISVEEITTIRCEDIAMPEIKTAEKRRIGF